MTIWIIEESVFGKDRATLEHAASLVGAQCRWLTMDQEVTGNYGTWSEDDSVVFRGSFEAAESFRSARPNAKPGVIGNQSRLNCASYYPKFGDQLLNSEHTFLPVSDLQHYWKDLQDNYESQGLFVRPDTGAKAFSGQLVADLQEFLMREKPYLSVMDPGDLCVVAPPKQVVAEYRLIVVNSRVVAGGRYKLATTKSQDPDVPDVILDYGNQIAARVELGESTYMLDIALEKNSRLSVIEVNSFSCSDFYMSDLTAVVKAVEAIL